MTRRSFILGILLAAAAAVSSQTLTLRMAANVPANSPWDLGLKRLASEFNKASNGKVKVTFLPTARISSESDIIQKMKMGIDTGDWAENNSAVDGALLTTYGVAELYPDSLVLSLPSFVRSDEEFDAALAAIRPFIDRKLSDRYVVLAISKGGWVRYFSRGPIIYPADLAKIRISISPEDNTVIRLMQSVGSRVVKGDTAAFLLQLNSNGVDAACVSPIYIGTLWSQFRGKINYMSSFKVSPFIGAVVFTKSSWSKVPADLRPKLEKIVRDMAQSISLDSEKLENDAIASMIKDGLKIPSTPSDAEAKWNNLIAERRNGLIAEMFSADILNAIDSALDQVRTKR